MEITQQVLLQSDDLFFPLRVVHCDWFLSVVLSGALKLIFWVLLSIKWKSRRFSCGATKKKPIQKLNNHKSWWYYNYSHMQTQSFTLYIHTCPSPCWKSSKLCCLKLNYSTDLCQEVEGFVFFSFCPFRLSLTRTRLLTKAARGFMCRAQSKADSVGESDNDNKDYIPLVRSVSFCGVNKKTITV